MSLIYLNIFRLAIRLFASKCDALEALELGHCLLDTGAALVRNFRNEGGDVFGVLSTSAWRPLQSALIEANRFRHVGRQPAYC